MDYIIEYLIQTLMRWIIRNQMLSLFDMFIFGFESQLTWVSLFNDISTFMCYLIPKPYLEKHSCDAN